MAELIYRDLPEFGLPLVPPEHPSFESLVREMESCMGPFPPPPDEETDRSAVLRNQSGRAILALEYFWRYTAIDGSTRESRCSTLNSGAQRDVLTGQSKAFRDWGTFILPDSNRWITEGGIFGSNLDVLTPDELPPGQGFRGGFGRGGGHSPGVEQELTRIELVLDSVILEDGLCVGPNENGMFEAVNESLDRLRHIAQAAVDALRNGASEGRIFEIVRPLARYGPPPRPDGKRRHDSLSMNFGSEAIHRLTNESTTDLLAWFEKAAQPRTLQLRRP